MQVSIIAGFLEPKNFGLQDSLSWSLTAGLKSKQSYTIRDHSSDAVGAVDGIVPLLQPISLTVLGVPSLLAMMRVNCTVIGSFDPGVLQRLDIHGPNGSLGTLIVNEKDHKRLAHMLSGLVIYGDRSQLGADDIGGLSKLIVYLRNFLWAIEPINWTTHNLHLAPDGTAMTAADLQKLSVGSGVVSVAGGAYTIAAGITPAVVQFKPMWAKAGRARVTAVGQASCSASSTSDTSSSDDLGSGGGGGGASGTSSSSS